jgi:hypothetical protein
MNLYSQNGDWSGEVLASAASKKCAPNLIDEVKALPVKPYPLSDADAALSYKQRVERDKPKEGA